MKIEKTDKGEEYKFDFSELEKEKGARADLLEPFYLAGDLFGFTIQRGTLTPGQIDLIFEREKRKLNITHDFHKANGYYETDDYEKGNKLYFRGYCIQQLEEISKNKTVDELER